MILNLWVCKGLIRYFLCQLDEMHLISHIKSRIDVRFAVVVILFVKVDCSKGLDVRILFTNLLILEGVKVFYSSVCGINDHHHSLVKAAPLDYHRAPI